MAEFKSAGHCVYCRQLIDQQAMTHHLNTHFIELEQEERALKRYFHIRVDADEYFLHLLITATSSLDDLDDFLRQIWLECCGHHSAFMGLGHVEYPMSKKLSDLFERGFTCEYHYDMDSTSYLNIKVLSDFEVPLRKKIILLSRNEPLPIICHSCKEAPASQMCTAHNYNEELFFCEMCVGEHLKTCEAASYALLPVVNSPRMGMCAYTGGMIDKERDGVYNVK